MAIDNLVEQTSRCNRVSLGGLLDKFDGNNLYIYFDEKKAYIFDEDYLKQIVAKVIGDPSKICHFDEGEKEKLRGFCTRVYKVKELNGDIYLTKKMREHLPKDFSMFCVFDKEDHIDLEYS